MPVILGVLAVGALVLGGCAWRSERDEARTERDTARGDLATRTRERDQAVARDEAAANAAELCRIANGGRIDGERAAMSVNEARTALQAIVNDSGAAVTARTFAHDCHALTAPPTSPRTAANNLSSYTLSIGECAPGTTILPEFSTAAFQAYARVWRNTPVSTADATNTVVRSFPGITNIHITFDHSNSDSGFCPDRMSLAMPGVQSEIPDPLELAILAVINAVDGEEPETSENNMTFGTLGPILFGSINQTMGLFNNAMGRSGENYATADFQSALNNPAAFLNNADIQREFGLRGTITLSLTDARTYDVALAVRTMDIITETSVISNPTTTNLEGLRRVLTDETDVGRIFIAANEAIRRLNIRGTEDGDIPQDQREAVKTEVRNAILWAMGNTATAGTAGVVSRGSGPSAVTRMPHTAPESQDRRTPDIDWRSSAPRISLGYVLLNRLDGVRGLRGGGTVRPPRPQTGSGGTNIVTDPQSSSW
ncbi:MAG: hypothetical protein ABH859_05980 [Pseudomonadota bacterium]